ncbi:acyltransferase family protein [Pantoea cypripedii]|uniref:acyltransferase family protein n=1 Tax=Pantoea cypripedii TaxID=55209 RepID=UPI001301B97E|nr:acyltransferase [Pantoea cypripedii]MBP2200323.1 peptidoglycan/LPS O-acetylase OafA/YrhL [Pantoea cypripedii]
MTLTKPKPIYGIDIIRFLCAAYVMLFHLSYWIGVPGFTAYKITNGSFDFPWAEGITSAGRVGVDIFFVISGFVIAYSAQGASAAKFVRSRILRLFPAAWICASITLVVALAVDHRSSVEVILSWVRSVLFIPIGDHIDGTYWTLGIECSFYFIIFAVIAINAFNKIEYVMTILTTASTLFCYFIFIYRPDLGWLSQSRPFQLSLIVNACEFGFGYFLYGLLYNGLTKIRCYGIVCGLVGSCILVFHSLHGTDSYLGVFLWLLSSLFIYLSVEFNEYVAEVIGKGGGKIVRILGLSTYPLYLIHQLVGSALMGKLSSFGISQTNCLISALSAMFVLSLAISIFIEPKLRLIITPVVEKTMNKINNFAVAFISYKSSKSQ